MLVENPSLTLTPSAPIKGQPLPGRTSRTFLLSPAGAADRDTVRFLVAGPEIAKDPLMFRERRVDVSFMLVSSNRVGAIRGPMPAMGHTGPVLGESVLVTCPGGDIFGVQALVMPVGY